MRKQRRSSKLQLVEERSPAGHEPGLWRPFGTKIGEAVGQDESHGRPNAVLEHGLDEAYRMLRQTMDEACAVIPRCETKQPVVGWVDRVASRIDETLRTSARERKVS